MKRLILLSLAVVSQIAFSQERTEYNPAIAPTTSFTEQTQPITEHNTFSSASLAEKNYQQLKELLPMYQYAATQPWPLFAESAKLKVGVKNKWVILLRDRLVLLDDLQDNTGSPIFDEQLADAVRNFQTRHGLQADGVVGKNTRAELNVSPEMRIHQIQMNMQRWTHLSGKLGPRYLMVNIPDFQLYIIENGEKVLTMKTIVGRPERQTPELTSKITTLVFKPYWNVPPRIASKDIVPKAINDPNYLDDNNIRVYDSEDSSELDDDAIDWRAAQRNGRSFHFRQDPGENNSLGLVKFEFPNPYDVYLHDTPVKELFSQDKRDFSSGCIRLENPFDLVSYVMQDNPNWSQEKMDNLLDQDRPSYVKIPKSLPVIITYLTAWVDENGQLNFRDDIYDKDSSGTL